MVFAWLLYFIFKKLIKKGSSQILLISESLHVCVCICIHMCACVYVGDLNYLCCDQSEKMCGLTLSGKLISKVLSSVPLRIYLPELSCLWLQLQLNPCQPPPHTCQYKHTPTHITYIDPQRVYHPPHQHTHILTLFLFFFTHITCMILYISFHSSYSWKDFLTPIINLCLLYATVNFMSQLEWAMDAQIFG